MIFKLSQVFFPFINIQMVLLSSLLFLPESAQGTTKIHPIDKNRNHKPVINNSIGYKTKVDQKLLLSHLLQPLPSVIDLDALLQENELTGRNVIFKEEKPCATYCFCKILIDEKMYLQSLQLEDGMGNLLVGHSFEYTSQGFISAHTISGNLTGETADERYSTRFFYDKKGHLTKIVEDSGKELGISYQKIEGEYFYTTYLCDRDDSTYDILGRMICQKDERGNSTYFTYSSRGKLTALFFSDGSWQKRYYFLDGSLKKIQTSKHLTLEYERDFSARPTLLTLTHPLLPQETITVEYTDTTCTLTSSTGKSFTYEMPKKLLPKQLLGAPSSLSEFKESFSRALWTIYDKSSQTVTFAKAQLEWFFDFRSHFEDVAFKLIDKSFWILLGYNPDKTRADTWGTTELCPHVRVTQINGILNAHSDITDYAEAISQTHGGIPVHYVYAASQGFTADILRGLVAKVGILSEQAKLLAHTWKKLFKEIKDTPGAKIIHYAHSLGGTDTYNALGLLTPEEREMIQITTFGSAYLIPDSNAMNYVSFRDVIPSVVDFYGYYEAIMGRRDNVIFIGRKEGIPLIDHTFSGNTYRTILEELGRKFQEDYLLKTSNTISACTQVPILSQEVAE